MISAVRVLVPETNLSKSREDYLGFENPKVDYQINVNEEEDSKVFDD